MIIRDQIKAAILTQINSYVESGAVVTFENENRNSTYANTTPAIQYEDLPYKPHLEWVYKIDLTIIKSLGERMENSFTTFIQSLDNYRKVLGSQQAKRTPLEISNEHILLYRVSKFAWVEENKNIEVKITLEYSHIEVYA